MRSFSKIPVQVFGHRGAAGIWPQNSLQGFLYAVDLGVDAIEMDVVISGDKKVVVSHEPYMASDYVLTPGGEPITHEEERDYNLYRMDYSEIKKFDAGSKFDPRILWKKRMKTYKPLLEEVIETVEDRLRQEELKPVIYSIELKSDPSDYGSFQPEPAEFIDLVMEILKKNELEDRLIMQSFDPNLLNVFHSKYPEKKISYLSMKGDPQEQLEKLQFTPDYFSPHHFEIKNKAYVDALHQKNIKVIPWTVNRRRHIKKMLNFGVDGIISDYPRRVINRVKK